MNLLFAVSDLTELVAVVVVPGIVLTAITSLIAIRNNQRRRQWDHEERMKAMELGHVLPTNQSSWARASVCIAIGCGVPIGSFLFTWLATLQPGTAHDIWIGPTLVSSLAVFSSSMLAGQLFASTRKPNADKSGTPTNGKPAFDDDVLDVVSRRG